MRVLAALCVALLVPSAAVAAETGPASNVGPTSASIAGTVDAGGGTVSYHFEYGTSSSYGLQTPSQAATGGQVDVHADLTGLTTDTTYHYRLVATNGSGADRTFHTAAPPGPPTATTNSARNVTAVGARLTARVDPNGRATTYRFEYGSTTGYGRQTAETSAGSGQSATSVSATIGGLQPNTRYHFRVVATNAAGVARGRDRTFTTLRNPRAITVSTSPNPAVWSGSTTLSGRITGQGVGGTTVALERQDFPFTGPFYLVGTKRASGNGSFSFTVGPLWALARLRVSTRTTIAAASPVVEVRNALRVGLRATRAARHDVRLSGSVSPRVPRGLASLQKRSPHGRWVTLRRAVVKPLRGSRSRYTFTVRRGGRYRVVVLPRDAFAHVRGTSRELRIR
jgi:hypothetical protein